MVKTRFSEFYRNLIIFNYTNNGGKSQYYYNNLFWIILQTNKGIEN